MRSGEVSVGVELGPFGNRLFQQQTDRVKCSWHVAASSIESKGVFRISFIHTCPSATHSCLLTMSGLINAPPGLATMRERLFYVSDPVILSHDDYEAYWPYISNVWSKR